MRNITFSADEELIEKAREQARRENSTLNEEFRRWLAQYTGSRDQLDIKAFLQQFSHFRMGKKPTRDELNER